MKNKSGAGFPVLLVDDEDEILFSTSVMLRGAGFGTILTESDSRRVLDILAAREVALIVLDLYMPVVPGYDLLKELKASHPDIPVIVMTAADEIESAVECMKAGAFDYFVKPAEKSRLLACVQRAMELHTLRHEVSALTRRLLSDQLEDEKAFEPVITRSPAMRALFRYMEAVSSTGQPALITGETGVGKELVARVLHELSGQSGPFVAVNSAGLDDQMFSDTLFGHCKGAFTGADLAREGLLARAAAGTLFLDEIGDLQMSSQIKLLRLLQEGEYYPLGSDVPKKCDARIIVATNRNLKEMVADDSFRKDLYYRLSYHQLQIPPLRERLEDLPLLVDHFLDQAAQQLRKAKPTPPPELGDYLASYDFPGNIRELNAMIFDAVTRHQKGVLSLASFRDVIGSGRRPSAIDPVAFCRRLRQGEGSAEAMPTLKEAEDSLIAHALKLARGNQGIAATYLGLTRQALNKRLNRRGSE